LFSRRPGEPGEPGDTKENKENKENTAGRKISLAARGIKDVPRQCTKLGQSL